MTYNEYNGVILMIRELMHDPIFLACRSENAAQEDIDTAKDLLDTLIAHKDECVGMAANMIGVCKRIIVFAAEKGTYMTMLNPVILKEEKPYETEEACLSLLGGPRKCKKISENQGSVSDSRNADTY